MIMVVVRRLLPDLAVQKFINSLSIPAVKLTIDTRFDHVAGLLGTSSHSGSNDRHRSGEPSVQDSQLCRREFVQPRSLKGVWGHQMFQLETRPGLGRLLRMAWRY